MTPEERVSFGLLNYFQQRPGVVVLSWHPPAAKAYAGHLIRIPRKREGKATRERYHLDFIFLVGELLVVQELKGAASELGSDVLKMRGLLEQYPLEELRALLEQRIPDRAQELAQVSVAVVSVGCETLDGALPDDVLCFCVGDEGVQIQIGSKLPDQVRQTLERVFTPPPT